VITQIVAHPNAALRAPGVTWLGECYKQLNSSVGKFAAATLIADTAAVESTSPGDATFRGVDHALRLLDVARDALALRIKRELENAAFDGKAVRHVGRQLFGCQLIIHAANVLASHS